MSYIDLITYKKAQEEILKLQKYVTLIDKYEVDSLNKFIIKSYAITNSSSGVIKQFNASKYKKEYQTISREYIFEVIKSSPVDDLHRIIRKGYKKKYKV